MAAGEVSWAGVEPLGGRDGRIALYLTDHAVRLRPPAADSHTREGGEPTGRAVDVLAYLRQHGASFFGEIHAGTGSGFPQETVDALWELVWASLITNDTLHPLRAYVRTEEKRTSRRRSRPQGFRSRRLVPRTAEGRWSVLETRKATRAATTEWSAALAQQLLTRHGVVTRETVAAEGVSGGFSAVYDVLKAMEESGRIRRGYFVGGLGGAQFALPPAVDMLRSFRDAPEQSHTVILAATDPANPYGAIVKWPATNVADGRHDPAAGADDGRGPTRSVGARVIVVDGFAAGYLRRGERELLLAVPDAEPGRSRMVKEVARALLELASAREPGRQGMLIAEINGSSATNDRMAHLFVQEGFSTTAMGLQARIQGLRPKAEGLREERSSGTEGLRPKAEGLREERSSATEGLRPNAEGLSEEKQP
jgi:ATP-dependent helicase Lhr and Lhr-like helicase